MGKINSLTDTEQKEYLKNKYGINAIKLYEQVQSRCPLGEQVGVTNYEITIIPGQKLAEFIQLHWDIQEMMGKLYTLESGASNVMEIIKKHYTDAKYIEVMSTSPPNRHMAVDIVLKYEA